MVEKNERKSAGSNELADYLTTKRIEFSYSTGKLGKNRVSVYDGVYHVTTRIANRAMLLKPDKVKERLT